MLRDKRGELRVVKERQDLVKRRLSDGLMQEQNRRGVIRPCWALLKWVHLPGAYAESTSIIHYLHGGTVQCRKKIVILIQFIPSAHGCKVVKMV